MKILFDTSVLVAGLVATHPHHGRALPILQAAAAKEIEALISSHTLAEPYGALTKLPVRPRFPPALAREQIETYVLPNYTVIELGSDDYLSAISRAESLSLQGGVIYDALIGQAAEKAGAEVLLTFNRKHFDRLGLDLEVREP